MLPPLVGALQGLCAADDQLATSRDNAPQQSVRLPLRFVPIVAGRRFVA